MGTPVSMSAPNPPMTTHEKQVKYINDVFNFFISFELVRKVYIVFIKYSLVCLHKLLPIDQFVKVLESLEPRFGEPVEYERGLENICEQYMPQYLDPLRADPISSSRIDVDIGGAFTLNQSFRHNLGFNFGRD
ncbi:MAG: hypothetical protein P0S95_06585 [Rhabdochlamydiaceae bacterium]|nr:hypothetical protein [Candidatus Amphrikana amoebophyrae]